MRGSCQTGDLQYFLRLAMLKQDQGKNSPAKVKIIDGAKLSSPLKQLKNMPVALGQLVTYKPDSTQYERSHPNSIIAISIQSSTMQQAESQGQSYRLSVLEEYHNRQDNKLSDVLPAEDKENCEIGSKRGSPRLTRISSKHPDRNSNRDTLHQLLQMMPTSLPVNSQRGSLFAELEKAIEQLSAGVMLQKYCFNCFKVERVILTFTEDFEFMSILRVDNSKQIIRSLKDLTRVTLGTKSHRLHQYALNGYSIDEKICFSMMFSERSYDFQTETAEECQQIVDWIQLLKESS